MNLLDFVCSTSTAPTINEKFKVITSLEIFRSIQVYQKFKILNPYNIKVTDISGGLNDNMKYTRVETSRCPIDTRIVPFSVNFLHKLFSYPEVMIVKIHGFIHMLEINKVLILLF